MTTTSDAGTGSSPGWATLRGRKERDPGFRIAVMGCMAQRLGQRLLDETPHVDLVIGPDGYRALPELIGGAVSGLRAADVAFKSWEHYEDVPPVRADRVGAFVSVPRGCDYRCTFCVVPMTRGPERSRTLGDVVTEVRGVADQGITEVTLLGQTVNSYHDGAHDFADLLRAFLGEAGCAAGITSACLGVAGPVEGNRAKVTYLPWFIDGPALAQGFGIGRVEVVNDFAAAAQGVAALRPDDLVSLQEGRPLEPAPRLLIGAGTGLGVAALLPEGKGWRTVGGEGVGDRFGQWFRSRRENLSSYATTRPRNDISSE